MASIQSCGKVKAERRAGVIPVKGGSYKVSTQGVNTCNITQLGMEMFNCTCLGTVEHFHTAKTHTLSKVKSGQTSFVLGQSELQK